MTLPQPTAPAPSSGDMLAAASAAIAAGAPAAPGQPAPETPAAPPAPSVDSVVPSEPAEQQAPEGDAPKVHPAWAKVLEGIPEVFHEAIIAQANASSRNADEAIAKARQQAAPEGWQEIIAQASEAGLEPAALLEAYQGQAMLQEALLNDPDGLIDEINSTIDELVASGQITRREGARQKAEAEEQLDDMLTDEQREIRELKQWREEQEAQRAREEQERQAAEAERQQDESARNFMDTFEKQMRDVGVFYVNEQGQLASTLPEQVLNQLGDAAADLVDAGSAPDAAVRQAWTEFSETITKFGGQIPQAQPAAGRTAPPPVVGGSAATPPAAALPATATSKDARENAMLAAIREAQGTQ